ADQGARDHGCHERGSSGRREKRAWCGVGEILGGQAVGRQQWRRHRPAPDIPVTMVRHLLFLLLVALLALVIVGQVREAAQPGSTDQVSDSAASADLTLRAGASEDPAARAPSPPSPPPLDYFARQGVRTRLGAEVDRHYLDSLFAETDSIVRHWPAG